jgi:glycosidase
VPHRLHRRAAIALACALLVGACGPATPPDSTAPSTSASATAGPTASDPSPGVACTPAATPASEDWNQRTWYEVFVRSFADGDGDGIGDFKGLTAKLDHLNDGDPATTDDLGVGGLWLMPVAESPSYHGYDVTDYRAIEPDYGTREDFEAFLTAAHDRGIAVIVDLVMNHSSVEHPWFEASRDGDPDRADWYVWEDENPSWLGPSGQVVWHEAHDRYYYGVFWEGMPDLNLRSEAVTAELRDVARFWLEDMGVDGFRLDAAKHLIEDGKDAQTNTPETKAWLAGFKEAVEAIDPGAVLVGEVWDPPSIAGAYVPDSLDMTFDFGLATAMRLAIENGRAAPLRTALGDTAAAWPVNQQASFLSNHDQDRIMSQLYGDLPSAKLAAFMLLTVPGAPFIYYGEEIGMTGRKPDERIRTPMRWTADEPAAGFSTVEPWQPLSDDPPEVNVATQLADPDSLLRTYGDLIRVRSQHAALREGGTTVLDSDAEPVIGWLRTTADETLLVLVNVGDEPVTGYSIDLAGGPLCGAQAATHVGSVGGDPGATITAPVPNAAGGMDAWTPVAELAPRSGFVISLEPAP